MLCNWFPVTYLSASSHFEHPQKLKLTIMTAEKLIDKIFSQLDDWRYLPAYQLERRADIFFSIYLTDIFKSKFNQDIEYIIPELPVRIGTLYKHSKFNNPNLSFKIDYVAVCNKTNKFILLN